MTSRIESALAFLDECEAMTEVPVSIADLSTLEVVPRAGHSSPPTHPRRTCE